MLATFAGGDVSGHVELKLHDDKRDLELWLAEDAHGLRPFDVSLDTTIEIEFVDAQGRKVTLRPRDRVTNKNEDGEAGIRAGKTNYFIFPGQPGDDASWLKGEAFRSMVVVRFVQGAQRFTSVEFSLTPHVH